MKAYVDASPTKLCVLLEDKRKIVKTASKPHTNNEAEYLAVLQAVIAGATEVYSDSQLVVKQLNGEYKVNKPELLYLCNEVLKRSNGKVKFVWVPRDENPAGGLV